MLLNGVMQLINFIILCLGGLISFIMNLLPDSPFKMLDNSPIASYLKYINFFIPVGLMLDALFLFLAAFAIFYFYQIALRWIKAVGE